MVDRRLPAIAPSVGIVAAMIAVLAGCGTTAHPEHRPNAADRGRLAGYFQRLNASAAAGPTAQARFLTDTQDRSGHRDGCGLSGMTLREQPAWPTLRGDPGWLPPGGTHPPAGTVFVVAVSVTISRAGEVIGNQIGSVRLVIANHTVYGFAPCAT